MFHEITTHLYPQTNRAPYPIESRVRSAIRYSEGHPIVQGAADYLRGSFDTLNFSGNDLLNIWRNYDVPFTTKCLATFWWGNLSHQIATAYSYNNMERLGAISGELLHHLELTSSEASFDTAIDRLRTIFMSFEPGGQFKLDRVDVSFFTKIFEFYFASHPLESNPEFLPIICDMWLRKGVFVEMDERGEDYLKNCTFRNATSLTSSNSSYVESYITFCIYFNQRVMDLKNEFPELTAFALEGYIFSPTGRDYINRHLE